MDRLEISRRSRGRGRPPVSSRRTLEDAAAELFLEKTYPGTSVSDITSRAGVSRTTFFNYFRSKSDVLWVDFDEAIGILSLTLESGDSRKGGVIDSCRDAILATARVIGKRSVPWALAQTEAMDCADDLRASGMARLLAQGRMLEAFVRSRLAGQDFPDSLPAAIAYALFGAACAGAKAWIDAGPNRGALEDYVDEALGPVCTGYRHALGEA